MAPIIAAGTYDLLHICGSDPPDDPVLTELDFVAAVDLAAPAASATAWNRIQQWFTHVMWPLWCDCDNGAVVPPATSAPLPPASKNPALPSGSAQANCWDVTQSYVIPHRAFSPSVDFNKQLLPNTPRVLISGATDPVNNYAVQLPVGATTVAITSQTTAPFPTIRGIVEVFPFTSAGVQVGPNLSVMSDGGATASQTFTLPGTATHLAAFVTLENSTDFDASITGTIRLNCAPANQLVAPCCPPDPMLDQRLTGIVQMLQVIANQLVVGTSDLVDSTQHIGLSGSGTITLVNSCAAIRVTVTAGLELHPNNPGSPNYYFSLGFITSVAAGSPLKGWRLVYASQTFPLAAYADQVGFTLPPGVVVNITEQLAS